MTNRKTGVSENMHTASRNNAVNVLISVLNKAVTVRITYQ